MTAPASRPLKFSDAMRLKRSSEFARIKQHGNRIVRGCLIANWMELPAGAVSRLGVITSRKVGGSVIRSRARRLLREVFRLNRPDLCRPVDIVLIARRSIANLKYTDVEADYLNVLRRAQLLNPAP